MLLRRLLRWQRLLHVLLALTSSPLFRGVASVRCYAVHLVKRRLLASALVQEAQG